MTELNYADTMTIVKYFEQLTNITDEAGIKNFTSYLLSIIHVENEEDFVTFYTYIDKVRLLDEYFREQLKLGNIPLKVPPDQFDQLLETGATCWDKKSNALKYMPYKEYLQTEFWDKQRKGALKRALFRCQLCNKGKAARVTLDVHHRTYERRGRESPEDLIVLCRNCHSNFHNK